MSSDLVIEFGDGDLSLEGMKIQLERETRGIICAHEVIIEQRKAIVRFIVNEQHRYI